MENFVEEAMPQSLPILEAIYGKIFFSGGKNFQNTFSNIRFGTRDEVKTTANIMNGMVNNARETVTSLELSLQSMKPDIKT